MSDELESTPCVGNDYVVDAQNLPDVELLTPEKMIDSFRATVGKIVAELRSMAARYEEIGETDRAAGVRDAIAEVYSVTNVLG